MLELVLATRNRGKIREFSRLFRELAPGWQVVFLSAEEVGLGDIPETGSTFEENARIKAVSAASCTGSICLGEDSGLEVDALGGAPGVRSHRFSASGLDEDNNAMLLKLLHGIPFERRTARYKCAICVASPAEILAEATGIVDGVIATEPRGSNGFGYDPLFYVPELGKTFGEASDVEKDRLSHRRRALELVVARLAGVLGQGD